MKSKDFRLELYMASRNDSNAYFILPKDHFFTYVLINAFKPYTKIQNAFKPFNYDSNTDSYVLTVSMKSCIELRSESGSMLLNGGVGSVPVTHVLIKKVNNSNCVGLFVHAKKIYSN
jgi:hypothetical protein